MSAAMARPEVSPVRVTTVGCYIAVALGYLTGMESDGLGALAAQLREQPSPAVRALSDEHLSHLAGAIRAARHHQARELEAAAAQALDGVPRILRGPVKKMVGG